MTTIRDLCLSITTSWPLPLPSRPRGCSFPRWGQLRGSKAVGLRTVDMRCDL